MPLLIGGAVASLFGFVGLLVWWSAFATLLKGAIPILLILGGILAFYIGYDDLQEKHRQEKHRQDEKLDRAREEIEQIRAKAELYREELERLREETRKSESRPS